MIFSKNYKNNSLIILYFFIAKIIFKYAIPENKQNYNSSLYDHKKYLKCCN